MIAIVHPVTFRSHMPTLFRHARVLIMVFERSIWRHKGRSRVNPRDFVERHDTYQFPCHPNATPILSCRACARLNNRGRRQCEYQVPCRLHIVTPFNKVRTYVPQSLLSRDSLAEAPRVWQKSSYHSVCPAHLTYTKKKGLPRDTPLHFIRVKCGRCK